MYTTIRPKLLGSSFIYLFHLYTTIRPKSGVILTLYFIYCVDVSYATFMAVLIYSVHCIHGGTALIFRTLCPWLYEVSSIRTYMSEAHNRRCINLVSLRSSTKQIWKSVNFFVCTSNIICRIFRIIITPITFWDSDMVKHELRITSCELRVTSWKVKSASWNSNPRFTSSNPRVTSSNPRVPHFLLP